MARRKTTRVKNKNQKSSIILLLIVLAVLLGVFYSLYLRLETRPIVESPKTEQKRIPKTVTYKKPKPDQAYKIPILMYHYVEYVQDKNDTTRQALDVTPYTFEQEIKDLKEAGYSFLTADDLADILDGKKVAPDKSVLITFDDGHWDLDTNVLPILKKYNVKATAYIIPGFLGGSDFLTKAQLKDVVNSHLVEIGAHTVHHVGLKGKIYPVEFSEIFDSKTMLENEFGITVNSFAYPNGEFDDQAVGLVKSAGFTTAMSTIPGNEQSQNNRFFLFRLRPGGRSGENLIDFLETAKFK